MESLEITQETQQPQWYAMSSGCCKEMKIYSLLKDREHVEAFLPLQRQERVVGKAIRKRVITYRPVISSLLFVKATGGKMRELKSIYNSMLQFKMCLNRDKHQPIIVPNKQMEDFIQLYNNVEEDKRDIYMPDEIDLRPDAKVMIKDGPFAGAIGYFQQVRSKITKKGKREKRFVVKIDGFMACAAAIAECEFVSLPAKS